MKKLNLIFLFFILSINIYSKESLDSLKNIVQTKNINDTILLNTYCMLADDYIKINKDSAINYLTMARKYLYSNSSKYQKSTFFSSKMRVEYGLGDFEKAITTGDSILSILNTSLDSCKDARITSRFGIIYWYQSEFNKALECFIISNRLSLLKNDTTGLMSNYNNIGILYNQLKNYEEAGKYYKKSLQLSKIKKHRWNIGNVSTNLGIIYLRYYKDLDSAEFYFSQGAKNMRLENDLTYLAIALNNLGTLYMDIDQHEKSLSVLNEALDINKKLNDIPGQIFNLGNLGGIYKKMNNYDLSLNYLLQALPLLDITKSFADYDFIYGQLAKTYEAKGDYKNSLKFYKKHIQYKDSIFNDSKSKEIGKLEAKYEFEKVQEEEKRKKEIRNQKIETERQRKNNLQYSGIFVVVLILFALVFMTGKFAVSERMAEGLIFFTFLLFFEFMLVLVDPYIDNWSGGEPAYKLVFNALLAGFIFPLHAFFENILKKKIIKK